ncbi:MAG: folylpolyglutamate synthase/dihydrofolate synthase family protein [Pseudomonadota bacterium]
MAPAPKQLREWLDWLETLSPVEIDLGLERISRVFERLELAEIEHTFIVAGTNGKGSSVAMLEAFLRHDGEHVGAYTSPHIQRYNERIRIDAEEVDDATIVAAFERVESVRNGEHLTYFEFGTLAALVIFAEAGVTAQVLEIGLGGRLDAVNIVAPSVSLITNIALDHCDWLGDDIESIAAEKAGVMRAGKPCIFASDERPAAIDRLAGQFGASLIAANRDYQVNIHDGRWSYHSGDVGYDDLPRPALTGDVQICNAAGVLATLQATGRTYGADDIAAVLGGVTVMGRMQIVDDRWLLDVAHNPAAASALAQSLREQHNGEIVALIGMLEDKDVEGVVTALDPSVSEWIAVMPENSRALTADELARRIANATNRPCQVATSIDGAITTLAARDVSDTVLITGSFFLVGPALDAIESL